MGIHVTWSVSLRHVGANASQTARRVNAHSKKKMKRNAHAHANNTRHQTRAPSARSLHRHTHTHTPTRARTIVCACQFLVSDIAGGLLERSGVDRLVSPAREVAVCAVIRVEIGKACRFSSIVTNGATFSRRVRTARFAADSPSRSALAFMRGGQVSVPALSPSATSCKNSRVIFSKSLLAAGTTWSSTRSRVRGCQRSRQHWRRKIGRLCRAWRAQ